MDFRTVQQCIDADGWVTKGVQSHSDSSLIYAVEVQDPDDVDDVLCECEGFLYRGSCSHQKEALDLLCTWREIEGPEKQTPEDREYMICPRCRGETTIVTEVKE